MDSYLFPEDLLVGNQTALASDTPDQMAESLITIAAGVPDSTRNTTFLENVNQVLSYLKSGVRVFQQFLSNSSVSQLLKDGKI